LKQLSSEWNKWDIIKQIGKTCWLKKQGKRNFKQKKKVIIRYDKTIAQEAKYSNRRINSSLLENEKSR
jgi:hypothetical protein